LGLRLGSILNRKRKGLETRKLIFDAASQILIQDGLTSLTLEKVAEEAGLSKGGLLYHFPNKIALIEGLFDHHNALFEQRLQELYEREKDSPGAWVRAYALASLEQINDPDTASLYASLFAAEEKYTSAHQIMRNKYSNWEKRLKASRIDAKLAMLIRFTVDGMWFAIKNDYAPPGIDDQQWVLRKLFDLTEKNSDFARLIAEEI
jgi:AcrR family transcriptional regulator